MPRDATGVPFPPGVSGNPTGSKVGSRFRTARLLDRLNEERALELFETIYAAARGGDMTAARILADRLWPPRRGRPVPVKLPDSLDTAASLEVIVRQMADADISPEEARDAAWVVMAHGRTAVPSVAEPKKSKVVLILPDNGRGLPHPGVEVITQAAAAARGWGPVTTNPHPAPNPLPPAPQAAPDAPPPPGQQPLCGEILEPDDEDDDKTLESWGTDAERDTVPVAGDENPPPLPPCCPD
jgi:hypothetical protein